MGDGVDEWWMEYQRGEWSSRVGDGVDEWGWRRRVFDGVEVCWME